MITALRVELLRLRWRRAVLLLAAAAVVVPAIILAATVIATRPVSDAELRVAQFQADREIAAGTYDQDVSRCERRPARYGITIPGGDVGETRAACEEILLPRADFYISRSSLDLTSQRESGSAFGIAVLLALLAALAGTTFVGHDWNTGSMSNQVLFEPRRTRVWSAKAAALALAAFVLSLVVLGLGWSALWAFTAARDLTIAPQAVEAGYKQAVLGALLASGSAVAAYAATMLFRSTVATLGVLFALAVGSTVLIGVLGPGLQVLLPDAQLTAYLVGSTTRIDFDNPACSGSFGPPPKDAPCIRTVDRSDSVLYLGLLGSAVVAASVSSFRRRDVP